MLRKLVMVVVLLAVIGAAAFWFVTMPTTVSADALGACTPDLDNGKTMFYAGGCAACHATPNQEDKTKLGGGLRSEEHTSELQSLRHLVCRLLLEKKKEK